MIPHPSKWHSLKLIDFFKDEYKAMSAIYNMLKTLHKIKNENIDLFLFRLAFQIDLDRGG